MLEEIYVDTEASDYLFAGETAMFTSDAAQSRMANVLISGSASSSEESYGCTFVFRASADASGTFDIELLTDNRTRLAAVDGQLIPLGAIVEAPLTVE